MGKVAKISAGMATSNCNPCSHRCDCKHCCLDDLVWYYYNETTFNINEIASAIGLHYGLWRSTRHIKRVLHRLGLGRRRRESSMEDLVPAMVKEMDGGSRRYGIRLMHQVLKVKHKLVVKRQTVRDIMESIHPGTMDKHKQRRLKRREYSNKGPNHILHIDGYDKLSSFGFYIHGAIDGWSRKVIWLDVGGTNKDPKVIGSYFLDFVESVGGTSKILRMDNGTENGMLADIQSFLMESVNWQHYPSYIFGRSVANQRIEKFWQFCYHEFAVFWIDLFKDMEICGVYNPSIWLHRVLLQFCFTPLLRSELNHLLHTWNFHRVRKMKNTLCPSGIPESLYSMPELFNCIDQKIPVPLDVVSVCREACGAIPQFEYGCKDEIAEELLELMVLLHKEVPLTWADSLQLYGELLVTFESFDF